MSTISYIENKEVENVEIVSLAKHIQRNYMEQRKICMLRKEFCKTKHSQHFKGLLEMFTTFISFLAQNYTYVNLSGKCFNG